MLAVESIEVGDRLDIESERKRPRSLRGANVRRCNRNRTMKRNTESREKDSELGFK